MASSLSTLQQHLLCPICLEIFNDPVLLSCGHSFCKTCIKKSWTQNPGRECPVCRRRSSKEHPPPDLALRNTCESYLEQKKKEEGSRSQGVLCSLHSEKLSMFCVDDEKLVCVQCVTEDHQNHSFCSISKAAAPHTETLQTHLQTLEKKLDIFKNVKDHSDRVAAHIKSQFQQTEKQIQQEFEKLHQFLKTEEQNRISALRNEEAQKSQKMKNIVEDLENQIKEINTRIRESEDKIKNEALLLQDFKRGIQRAQYTVPDPKLDSVPLIDVAKHLGNLSFNVWRKMKDCPYYPVVLDPNTANSSLSISADLSSVSVSSENLQLPDNPERMSVYNGVLGSEGFSSGTHSWVVDVGGRENWVIGVAEESVNRKENIKAIPDNGFYCIWRWENEIAAGISDSYDKIIAEPTGKRISVILNWEKGQVTFLNYETNTALHTFTNTFRKKMYPYFYNESKIPLKILPLQTSITTKI